jgi:hypothetical protein
LRELEGMKTYICDDLLSTISYISKKMSKFAAPFDGEISNQ